MKSKISYLLVFIIPVFVSAQVTQEWVQIYNGPGNNADNPFSIVVDISGNIYVTGGSYGSGTSRDYATIKYNSSGVQQWVQRYNGPGYDYDVAYSLAVDNSGNVYVTGSSTGNGTNWDFATIKYNSSGVQLWVQRYNGPGNGMDIGGIIAIDNSGNLYATGYSTGIGTNWDYATIKYNSSGVRLWVQRYNGPGNGMDQLNSMAVDTSGNVYVTGWSTGIGSGNDFTTIKYDSSGTQQWVQRYNGPGNSDDNAGGIAVDNSGNVYVTGGITISGTNFDYATIKYNSFGVQQWVQSYGTPDNLEDYSPWIELDNSGNVYVTGYSTVSSTGRDYATIKYNSSGIQQWVQRYNGPGNGKDTPLSMAVDNSGNVYVTGWSTGGGSGLDYATIKYNSSGIQQWLMRYNNPSNTDDNARCLALDASGNVYVTGWSSDDYVTIKYSQDVGIQHTSNEIPDKILLEQNYPNPFNPTTNIKFDIPKKSFVKLVIYNSLGKEVASLVNEELNAGSYQTDWNASEFPSGVYFYKLETENFIETKSMVLLK